MIRRRRAPIAALAAAVFIVAAVLIDLRLRARDSYLEGMRYLEWNAHPDLKKQVYDAEFARRRAAIEAQKSAGLLSDAECAQKIELARFACDRLISESSLKYAEAWLVSAAELFSPPSNAWTRLAGEKLVEVRELRRRELDGKKPDAANQALD